MRYCAWFVSWYSSISRCVNTSCQRSRTSSKRSSRSTVRTSRSSKSIAFDWCRRCSYSSKTSATVCSKKPPTCSLNSAAETSRFFSAEIARVHAARREALGIAIELLEARAHQADLIGLVVDREVRAVAEPIGVAPQDAPAGRVERQHPHAARHADQLVDALAHLARRPVRERDREDLVRQRLALGAADRRSAGSARASFPSLRRPRPAPVRRCARPPGAAGD